MTPSTGAASVIKTILTFAKNRLTWHGFCGPPLVETETQNFNDNRITGYQGCTLTIKGKNYQTIYSHGIYYLLVWYLTLTHFDLAQFIASSFL